MTREGYIEKVIYKSDDTGYTVFVVETEDGEETFVGNMFGVGEGMYVSAEGEYVNHPRFNIQFKFTKCETRMPENTLGIERYLGSGIIRGIGEVLAKRIVKKFKNDTLRIIDEEPERLAEVKGISERMARNIAESYSENREFQDVIMFLGEYGINPNLAMKIYNEYGDDTYRIVRENPYRLAEDISGLGFKTADDIAMKIGIAADSVYRTRSALIYTLNQASVAGHMFLPKNLLVKNVKTLLGVGEDDLSLYHEEISEVDSPFDEEFQNILTDLMVEGKIVIKNIVMDEEGNASFDMMKEGVHTAAVYSGYNYYVELNSAGLLSDLRLDFEIPDEEMDEALSRIEKKNDIRLEEMQRKAVKTAFNSGVAVITGGPGTGKTTIIKAVIDYYHNSGMKIELCAPTGRAAKRITESTGFEAQTIHRLLEFSGVPGDEGNTVLRFGRNSDNPLECDAVIVDEMSMVDSFLFYALLQAIPQGTRLILAGDVNQLPSVGAGNVLHDIIASKCFPVTELTRIFRQEEESMIIENAHRIKEGEHITITNKSRDFFFIPRNTPQGVTDELDKLILKSLPGYLNVNPDEIQVLTPMRKYELGVEALNLKLQEAINPASPEKREKQKGDVVFREGDKVMQIRNNYKIEWKIYGNAGNFLLEEGVGIFNGDMGTVKLINSFDEEMTVLFDDGREAVYQFNMLDELEHAFAVTIHKSQGSEYPAVIIPIMTGPKKLLNRNLLYTAVTRAKKAVVILGNINIINNIIDNVDEQKRYTGFAERLMEICGGGLE